MKTSKIVEITSYPPPHSGWGVRVSYVKHELENLGHECQVLNLGINRKVKSSEYICIHNGIDYFFKVFWFVVRGYTVHAHVNGDAVKGLILALMASVLTVLRGRKCVLTFHAGPVQRYFPREKSGNKFWLFYILFLIPRTIICNNQAVKDKICEYGIPPQKVAPIPAFSTQYMTFSPSSLPEDLNAFINRSRPVIFSYIRMRTEFDLETLLSGIQRLTINYPDLGVVICGTGGSIDEEAKEKFFDGIDRLELQSYVFLIDDLPRDLFQTVLNRSDLYLRTPAKDGVCSSVLEALSHQIPVVASENHSRPSGVVCYAFGNPEGMANQVSYVLENYESVKFGIQKPELRDTVKDEIEVLTY